MPLLECADITVSFGNHMALEDLSFSVEEGDFLSVVGENGSGKTTLIRCLLGLQHYQGNIVFSREKKEIGYLAQQTIIQNDFPASIEEIVLSGCLNSANFKPFYSKKDKEKARDAMQKMNIFEIRKKNFKDCSGGQKQRVLLARALCASQGILILDEPVTGLDEKIVKEFYQLVDTLHKEEKYTIIMVTHDKEKAIQYSTKVLQLRNKLDFFGTATEYKQWEEKRNGTIS